MTGFKMTTRHWLAALALLTALPFAAQAQSPQTVRVAKQFGISYLPLIVMQEEHQRRLAS